MNSNMIFLGAGIFIGFFGAMVIIALILDWGE
jgi:hypothetical protein